MLNVDPDLIQELEYQILGNLILKPELFMIASLNVDDFVVNPLAYEIIQDQFYATGTLNTTSLAIQFNARSLQQWEPVSFVSSVIKTTNFENLCEVIRGHSLREKLFYGHRRLLALQMT